MKVSIVTLGCSKNDVDTEQMKALLDEEKYTFTSNLKEAEAIVVNTCGFIDQAKEESVDTILEMAEFKKTGQLKNLLLAGCLAQRYPDELLELIPEADGIIGPGYLSSINEALDGMRAGEVVKYTEVIEAPYLENVFRKEVHVTEYVKISEGCNNNCTYCIIPKLKGKNRSRKMEDILEEVRYLAENGCKEVILIGQNTTDYGIDLYNEYKLSELLHELESIEDLKWIRILYAYPDHFTDELIYELKNNSKVVPYIDIPLQHISDSILKKMARRTSKKEILSLISKLRQEIPNMVLRSTFIVGFPGETEEDFEELMEFIEQYPLNRVGCFIYSKEEGTPAALLPNEVEESIKEERQRILMEKQYEISNQIMENYLEETIECLVQEKVEDGLFIGRTLYDAPDIDGVIYIRTKEDLDIDSFIMVHVDESMEYDLGGDFVEYSK
ncbi:30S ribosomal protein S12 methylthiotransferase RimO [Peptoniphilus sp. KCTC 25270]|uniref:30S ribosomal protein S12 methylthiotransferase RimO n=1 Tax=Peptoniphilus sp. KCTC 25270 TaxID=2897414 RepID=UPI001E5D4BA4|nr:30S ribosomal protein S12 methylthiotransferase RimO [Peptoniphilus sp. KCTC 25270]MCD1146998.1 30S ribosomal protein S12 methylthiotransferase RimO [Peptoniphilus sp. KCTC 25270]